MSERKVLNKYIPPDFDPGLLKKHRHILKSDGFGRKRSGFAKKFGLHGRVLEIRMMFPFTFRCESCRDFTYVGTKFNSKVQRIEENYLGIQKYRFYGKCPNCNHMIIFKTDPKNGDYTLESGGTRTYDANRDAQLAAEAVDKEEEAKAEKQDTTERMLDKANHAYAEYEELERLTALKKRAGRMREREHLADLTLKKIMQEKFESAANEDELEAFRRDQEKACAEGSLGEDDWNEFYWQEAIDDDALDADGTVSESLDQNGNGPAADLSEEAPDETESAPVDTWVSSSNRKQQLSKQSQVPDVFSNESAKKKRADAPNEKYKGIKVLQKKEEVNLLSGYDSDD
ncbi:conserved hypothetical protein [Theileria equi strain WA]|uniref:Splicing factor YJU2 n=1 Tax=Theileria equi strain WA TaxID=1537102 RepID=L1LAF7_THEEQ|nr:conserved hypothetical protein [Theileria equi strain WA]EKX72158.1 conserved hypothetical protein [Theileria equi strain WA]|eukprot:XP_004831610.1 conserved hypothetical protein [Theileria equi strain WA]